MNRSKFAKKRNTLIKGKANHLGFLICSDTHYSELDIENNYANTGSIGYGQASYITIENGDIRLIETKY